MKEKISYFVAAFVVYFITGALFYYFLLENLDWKYVISWAVLMTILDFLVLRNISKWFKAKIKTR